MAENFPKLWIGTNTDSECSENISQEIETKTHNNAYHIWTVGKQTHRENLERSKRGEIFVTTKGEREEIQKNLHHKSKKARNGISKMMKEINCESRIL